MLDKEKKMRQMEEEVFSHEDMLTVPEAHVVANVTMACIRNWIRKYHIGKKVAGRFLVDPDKLQLLLKGEVGVQTKKIKF